MRLVAAVPNDAIGTTLTKMMWRECPQPAEADIRPLDGNSRFDPKPHAHAGLWNTASASI